MPIQKSVVHGAHKEQLRNKIPKEIKIGPLKIVLIDSKGQYVKTVFFSICNGLSQFMLGATNIMVFAYTLTTKDYHATVCTVGYHFFIAQAILSLNYTNGWSTPLRLKHRRYAHVMLQICALSCILTGTTIITVDKGMSSEAHGMTGVITAGLTVLTALFGPAVLFGGQIWNIIHVLIGLPTFVLSSICFCLGILEPSFKNWAGSTMPIVLIVFICFYTSFIVIMSVVKCIMRIKYLM